MFGFCSVSGGGSGRPPADEAGRPDAAPFVELAARSAFSLLDGASTPEALAERAAAIGMPALALADVFDLGGVVRFDRACRERGVRPLVGAEVLLAPDGTADGERRRARARPLVLLAVDRGGYGRLSGLITAARRNRPRGEPLLPEGALAEGTGGLLGLARVCAGTAPADGSGFPGPWTGEEVRRLAARFPDRLWIALEHHGLPAEARRCERWTDVSAETGIPWLPVNASRYARPSDRLVRDVLTCLRHGVTLDEAGELLLPNGEWYLKSAEQMAMRWCRGGWERRDAGSPANGPSGDGRETPQGRSPEEARAPKPAGREREHPAPAATPTHCPCPGCEGMRRTVEVAERCGFRIDDLEPRLPAFPVPGGRDADAFLRDLVEEGARERYGEALGPEHRRQIDHELAIIRRLELADYFLIVWDVVRFARRRGILVQGRGSAANSAVCYCLGITAVDPVGMDLLFERFLSEERDGAPDIDLDFAHRDREEVLQYVWERWGRERAAMVCETISYRGKMAVRDAARVLGFDTGVADRLSAEVDRGEAADAARRLAEGGAARAGLDPAAPRTRALLRVVRGLDRLPRHRSIHVGGFVLSDRPVGETVPVEEASMEERTILQWDKDDLAELGIIKIDLLGLGMLTALGDALAAVRRTRGVALDLADVPPDDEATYEMICEADTVGVFQIESRAQMNTLPRVKPRCFYDLVIEVALIRPGPIQGEMVHPYLRRRRGEEPVTYLDPRLEPLLERTLGVPLFQEQGMKVAVTLAGFTPAQADRLRRAMGFKRSEEAMREVGRELEEGLAANGVPPEVREKIFKQLTGFANYGFPESHAASFALLVYASAWLKRHYAPEFYCAMLNAQPMGFYAPATLVHDAHRHAVEVRPVDLARSDWDSTLEPAAGGGQGASGSGISLSRPARLGARASSDRRSCGVSRPSRGGSLEEAPIPDAPDPALRLGLRTVRGLGSTARDRLREAREEGRFVSVEDVVRRSGLSESGLRALAEAGAFRTLWPGRREALWELLRQLRGDAGPLAPRPRARRLRDRSPPAGGEKPGSPLFEPLSRRERVAADYRSTGLSPEGHPLEFLREALERRGVLSARELEGVPTGAEVAVAGIAICRQRPSTAKGVTFVTLEDETGFANFIFMSDVRERYRAELRAPLLVIEGEVENEEGVVNVVARAARPLSPTAGAEAVPSRDYR